MTCVCVCVRARVMRREGGDGDGVEDDVSLRRREKVWEMRRRGETETGRREGGREQAER